MNSDVRGILNTPTAKLCRLETLINSIVQFDANKPMIGAWNSPLFKQLATILKQAATGLQLDSFSRNLVAAWERFDTLCNKDGSLSSDQDKIILESFEVCEICAASIQWTNYHQGSCDKGHHFSEST